MTSLQYMLNDGEVWRPVYGNRFKWQGKIYHFIIYSDEIQSIWIFELIQNEYKWPVIKCTANFYLVIVLQSITLVKAEKHVSYLIYKTEGNKSDVNVYLMSIFEWMG